jgi:hypothetical protein
MVDRPSAVLYLDEADYQYGVGRLSLRVERVDLANPELYDGEVWLRVEGVRIAHNGVETGRRTVLVRARRLPPALRAQT